MMDSFWDVCCWFMLWGNSMGGGFEGGGIGCCRGGARWRWPRLGTCSWGEGRDEAFWTLETLPLIDEVWV